MWVARQYKAYCTYRGQISMKGCQFQVGPNRFSGLMASSWLVIVVRAMWDFEAGWNSPQWDVCLQSVAGAHGDGPCGWGGGQAHRRDGHKADGWRGLHQTLNGEPRSAGGAWGWVRERERERNIQCLAAFWCETLCSLWTGCNRKAIVKWTSLKPMSKSLNMNTSEHLDKVWCLKP